MKRKKKHINKYSIYKTLPPDMRPLKPPTMIERVEQVERESIMLKVVVVTLVIIAGLMYIAFLNP